MTIKLPERSDKHIKETASFKIFSQIIPDHWLIREVTERDYGIDCYIELVNEKKQCTGDIVSIQIKGRNIVSWNKTDQNSFTLSGIKISTTNYWYTFSVPVFILLVDISKKEIFYLPVKSYIKKNYISYKEQGVLSYKFNRDMNLHISNGLNKFLSFYNKEKNRLLFEQNLVAFISNYERYKSFILENTNRDIFLGVDTSRLLELTLMYNNMQFLYSYLDMTWDIDTLNSYQEKSQKDFGDTYTLYEREMDEIVKKLDPKLLPLILKIKSFVEEEFEYWMSTNIQLFNLITNIDDGGNIPWD